MTVEKIFLETLEMKIQCQYLKDEALENSLYKTNQEVRYS